MHRLHMGCIEVDDLLSVLLLLFRNMVNGVNPKPAPRLCRGCAENHRYAVVYLNFTKLGLSCSTLPDAGALVDWSI